MFPINSYILAQKGRLFLKKGEPRKALKWFDRALRYDFSVKVVINKALALLKLRKHKETVETIDKILKYDGKNSMAWYLKGKALMKLYQKTKGTQCLKKAEKYKKVPRSLLE